MSKTYKAVQASRRGVLELVELPLSEPPAGHVRVRVEACGVCHSDALTVEGAFPAMSFPRVPGHEAVGTIDAVGAGVERWSVGQRVGVGYLGGHCGTCEQCRRGDFVHCNAQPMTGVHTDGGYAEVMIAKASGLAAIPDELRSIDAAPLLCAGLTTFNALRKSKARPGDLVAIQGVGGLGHLAIQYAAYMGFRVVAIARGTSKRDLALKLGAHHYIDSTTEGVVAAMQKLGGAMTIIATASDNKSMSALIEGLAPEGEMIVVGLGGSAPMDIHALPLIVGGRKVGGFLTGSSIDSEDTMAFSVLQNVQTMIETYPLEKAVEAYTHMMNNQARFRVVLVTGQ